MLIHRAWVGDAEHAPLVDRVKQKLVHGAVGLSVGRAWTMIWKKRKKSSWSEKMLQMGR